MRDFYRDFYRRTRRRRHANRGNWRERNRARGGTPVHRYLQFFRFPRTPAVSSCPTREKTKSKIGENPRDKSRILSRGETRRDASDSAVQCELTTSHAIPCHAPFHSATVPFGLIPRVTSLFLSYNVTPSSRSGPFRALNHSDFRRVFALGGYSIIIIAMRLTAN